MSLTTMAAGSVRPARARPTPARQGSAWGDHDAGTGQPGGVDQRGVVGGVGNDEDARPGAAGTEGLRQGRDDREVGQVPRGEQARRPPRRSGQLMFQLGVQLRRPGDQA